MFESSYLTLLKSDADLVATVNTYEGEPAIFSEIAPGDAELPYLVFKIDRYPSDHEAVERFFINNDYYDRGGSWSKARACSMRIVAITDMQQITHARFTKIRLYRGSAGAVPETDTREVHYNTQITARACRKEFIDNL